MTHRICTSRIKSIKDTPHLFYGYHPVNVLSWHPEDTLYYEMSPYHLRTDGNEESVNEGGVLYENFWQGQKVYPQIYPIEVYCHPSKRGNPQYLWYKNTQNDIHIVNDTVLPAYYEWRAGLYACKKPIRYPNGREHRKECKFLLLSRLDGSSERLGYIDSRKRVYVHEYKRLIRHLPIYKQLLTKLKYDPDFKICIYEIDVPCSTKHGNYKCTDPMFNCTKESLEVLINDASDAFGHGLCLASALLEDLELTV